MGGTLTELAGISIPSVIAAIDAIRPPVGRQRVEAAKSPAIGAERTYTTASDIICIMGALASTFHASDRFGAERFC
jgi:hypothetical protein